MTRSLLLEEPRSKRRATRCPNPMPRNVPLYASRLTVDFPIFHLTRAILPCTLFATYLPRLSPERVTRIKGRFFCCAQLGEGA